METIGVLILVIWFLIGVCNKNPPRAKSCIQNKATIKHSNSLSGSGNTGRVRFPTSINQSED